MIIVKVSNFRRCFFICITIFGCDDSTTSPLRPVGGSTAGVEMSTGGMSTVAGASMMAGESVNLSGGDSLGGTEMITGGMSGGNEMTSAECVEETCDALDNDCDGSVDEDVICSCSEDPSCYGGPPATRGIGASLCAAPRR